MKKVQKEGKEDELLILFVAILTLAGLFFLYSTGTYNGKVKFGDAGYYLKKQLFASVLGMIAFWVMARIDYHRWRLLPRYCICVPSCCLRLSYL